VRFCPDWGDVVGSTKLSRQSITEVIRTRDNQHMCEFLEGFSASWSDVSVLHDILHYLFFSSATHHRCPPRFSTNTEVNRSQRLFMFLAGSETGRCDALSLCDLVFDFSSRHEGPVVWEIILRACRNQLLCTLRTCCACRPFYGCQQHTN
jgi:hypothetical protein